MAFDGAQKSALHIKYTQSYPFNCEKTGNLIELKQYNYGKIEVIALGIRKLITGQFSPTKTQRVKKKYLLNNRELFSLSTEACSSLNLNIAVFANHLKYT